MSTAEAHEPGQALQVPLDPARARAAVTFLSPPFGPRLPRAFEVAGGLDGQRFETLEVRRPEDARARPCWINGHPQYPVERDAFSLQLPPRPWRALRLTAADPGERWAVAEVLLHPAGEQAAWETAPPEAWAARFARSSRDARGLRADTLFRRLLAARHGPRP